MPKSARSPYARERRRHATPDPGASPSLLDGTVARIRRSEELHSVGPCDACRHIQRCSGADLACAALELFANAGRVSLVAPRQPSRVIFERMVEAAATPRGSPKERQRVRESQAVKNARGTGFMGSLLRPGR